MQSILTDEAPEGERIMIARNAFVATTVVFLTLLNPASAVEPKPFVKLNDEGPLRNLLIDHSDLKDPFTVQFRGVYVREVSSDQQAAPPKHVYCGELNAKNGYGGYTGWSRFLANDVTESPIVTIVDSESAARLVALFCKDAPPWQASGG
jgi:hypothetical protein